MTRRQHRLAARRAGLADSFKRQWKAYKADPSIIVPFGYEFFCRMHSGATLRNLIGGAPRVGRFQTGRLDDGRYFYTMAPQ